MALLARESVGDELAFRGGYEEAAYAPLIEQVIEAVESVEDLDYYRVFPRLEADVNRGRLDDRANKACDLALYASMDATTRSLSYVNRCRELADELGDESLQRLAIILDVMARYPDEYE